ncbi:E3 ubiquitin-protein ligase HERC1 [Biomphalaria glabrata]|nr:E3 ubiquitin-protein ligase HERC1 [Biomphalaria glabrata]
MSHLLEVLVHGKTIENKTIIRNCSVGPSGPAGGTLDTMRRCQEGIQEPPQARQENTTLDPCQCQAEFATAVLGDRALETCGIYPAGNCVRALKPPSFYQRSAPDNGLLGERVGTLRHFYLSSSLRKYLVFKVELAVRSYIKEGLVGLAVWNYIKQGLVGLAVWNYIEQGLVGLAVWNYIKQGLVGLAVWSYIEQGLVGLAVWSYNLTKV